MIALGSRLNDPATLKSSEPARGCRLAHVHPAAGEIGRRYPPDVATVADPSVAEVPAGLAPKRRHGTMRGAARRELGPQPGPVDTAEAMRVLNDRLRASPAPRR